MSLFVRHPIRSGQAIRPEDLIVLRSGKKASGLAPGFLQLFAGYRIRAGRDLNPEDPLDWGCIFPKADNP
jgi:sialic acid synthase SpsE